MYLFLVFNLLATLSTQLSELWLAPLQLARATSAATFFSSTKASADTIQNG